MNDDDFLETQIRNLRPGPLPPDLMARMEKEPGMPAARPARRMVLWVAAAGLAAAACIAIVINPPPARKAVAEAPPHLSVVQQESTLLNTRTLAFREHDGQVWELVEEKWRDDTVAMCSATPAQVRSTVIRPEVSWVPVEFQ